MIKEKWDEIKPALVKVLRKEAFDLSVTAVVVREDGAVIETNLSALSSHLNASLSLASLPIARFTERASEVGQQVAFEELINGEDGEEFAEQWDQAQADLRAGARCSINDIVRAIATARVGFNESPRQMLAVVMREEGLEVLLVGASAPQSKSA